MKKILSGIIFFSISFLFVPSAFSHCEIPCGIYGDEMRFDMIEEHINTVEKSMKLIVELSKEKEKNYNQLVRWINNKETHAINIQHIVSQYFMTQRVKPVEEKDRAKYKKYTEKITLLHNMLIHAMKTKQTTDPSHIKKLRSLLADFRTLYFGTKK